MITIEIVHRLIQNHERLNGLQGRYGLQVAAQMGQFSIFPNQSRANVQGIDTREAPGSICQHHGTVNPTADQEGDGLAAGFRGRPIGRTSRAGNNSDIAHNRIVVIASERRPECGTGIT
jgi:hypothetical protein